MSDSAPTSARSAWVLSAGVDVLADLAAGLGDLGLAVDRVIGLDISSQESADAAVQGLAAHGLPDLVVVSHLPPEAMAISPIGEVSPAAWQGGVCDALRSMIYLFRALGRTLHGHAAAIVVVGPSLSLVGCPEMVALSTLLEGQRGLVKSVARQWGASGISLNWVAAAPRALSDLFAEAPLAAKPDLVSVALGRPLDTRAEIAPILAFLAAPAGRVMTGATLTLDGGEWMVP